MKAIPFMITVVILSASHCLTADNFLNLSTPKNTVMSFYEAFEKADFEYQRKTVHSSIWDAAEKRFGLVKPAFESYQVLQTRGAKERQHDTYHLPEGDVDVLVKEIYREKNQMGVSSNMVSFVLREFDHAWLIIDILTLD